MAHKMIFRHLKPYQPKTFNVIFNGAFEINQILTKLF